jgi:hypothetical protein
MIDLKIKIFNSIIIVHQQDSGQIIKDQKVKIQELLQ